jgi:hypothetical protein
MPITRKGWQPFWTACNSPYGTNVSHYASRADVDSRPNRVEIAAPKSRSICSLNRGIIPQRPPVHCNPSCPLEAGVRTSRSKSEQIREQIRDRRKVPQCQDTSAMKSSDPPILLHRVPPPKESMKVPRESLLIDEDTGSGLVRHSPWVICLHLVVVP